MNNNFNYILVFLIISYLIYQDIFPTITKKIIKKEKMMSLDKIPPIDLQPKIEITRLKTCPFILFFEYNSTFNHVVNNGTKIYIDTLKPLKNRLIYNGHRYNLSKIEFNIGSTRFNGKKIPLELHFVNTSTINDYILRVIYPLNLTDSMKVFKNVYENNDYNIKNKTTGGNERQIDILDLYDIPSYVCCTPNKGKLKRINLETINYYLNNTKKFYQYKPSKKSVWIYNKPIKFNSLVGKRILDNLLK